MDEVVGVEPSQHAAPADDWWSGVEEEGRDALSLEALWAGAFVPPPPRPYFLDEQDATPDGPTTCDLCTWAWRDREDAAPVSASTELGWILTLAIVSVLSAAIGAVIMVTVMQCRSRMKNVGSRGLCSLCLRVPPDSTSTDVASREDSKEPTAVFHSDSSPPVGGRVWTWLTARRTTAAPPQLTTSSAPAENHYTVDEAYTAVGEALYAELDRDSNHTPAYQNTAYTGSDIEPDAPVSSAPSSAYYSDLSSTTVPERTYEAIGMASLMEPSWDGSGEVTHRKHPMSRLAAITETITVPSDYV